MNREKTVLGWKKDLADWDPLGSLEKDWGPTGRKRYISLFRGSHDAKVHKQD
jgi:hypothetical protein